MELARQSEWREKIDRYYEPVEIRKSEALRGAEIQTELDQLGLELAQARAMKA